MPKTTCMLPVNLIAGFWRISDEPILDGDDYTWFAEVSDWHRVPAVMEGVAVEVYTGSPESDSGYVRADALPSSKRVPS